MSIYQEIISNQEQLISKLAQKEGHSLTVELSSNVAHLSFNGVVMVDPNFPSHILIHNDDQTIRIVVKACYIMALSDTTLTLAGKHWFEELAEVKKLLKPQNGHYQSAT